MRPRIDFAAANLRVACESVSHMPSTIMYALFVLIAQITFIVIWVIAASGYATNNYSVTQTFNGALYHLDECTTYRYSSSFETAGQTFTCTSSGTCQTCICNDTLFWTSAVCSNIVHCTTASSVAAWWVTSDDVTSVDQGASLTRESFQRSCTTSLVDLFRSRGWSTLLNDDLIDLILNLGNIIIAALTMCVGYSYARFVGLDRVYITLLSMMGLF
eukprot:gene41425-51296_t